MALSRRQLLSGCTIWASLAAMPAALRVTAFAQPKADPTPVTKEMWTSLQGATFEVVSGSTRQTLTVLAVEDAPQPPAIDPSLFAVGPATPHPTPALTTFIVRFYGGVQQLKQGTYSFKNEQTGKFQLFIVPRKSPLSYDAIFNRL